MSRHGVGSSLEGQGEAGQVGTVIDNPGARGIHPSTS
jgi:hypothetical protein